jgi:antitoxin ParD1/3/4
MAKFAKPDYRCFMTTMNISLPESLKTFVDEQVVGAGYGSSSEYVRELIRRDRDRVHLRGLLLEGATSAPTAPVTAAYFEALREGVRAGGSSATG